MHTTCVARAAEPRVPTASVLQAKISFRMRIVPADGTSAAYGSTATAAYRRFVGSSRASRCLLVSTTSCCLPVLTMCRRREQSTMAVESLFRPGAVAAAERRRGAQSGLRWLDGSPGGRREETSRFSVFLSRGERRECRERRCRNCRCKDC